MASRNVLRVNTVEERAEYQAAVAEILRLIQNETKLTLIQISEEIDVSLGTISNAANKKGDLNPIYLKRLGKQFGVHFLDPYISDIGGRVVPKEPDDEADILPLLLSTAQLIAAARTEASPGGVAETLGERLGYLPLLRRVRRAADALIGKIEIERKRA